MIINNIIFTSILILEFKMFKTLIILFLLSKANMQIDFYDDEEISTPIIKNITTVIAIQLSEFSKASKLLSSINISTINHDISLEIQFNTSIIYQNYKFD